MILKNIPPSSPDLQSQSPCDATELYKNNLVFIAAPFITVKLG